MGSKGSYVLQASPQDAVSSTATATRNEGAGAEIESWLAHADRIHALHHHRQAAQHHEREAEWNAKWAEWHRAEAARLEGEV